MVSHHVQAKRKVKRVAKVQGADTPRGKRQRGQEDGLRPEANV